MDIQSVFDLSPAEKLQLVEDLWDDFAKNPENIPLLDWQNEELDRRIEEVERNPDSLLTWEEAKASIRAKYGR
jgi:putative addiction module component (TIGR02574 family)